MDNLHKEADSVLITVCFIFKYILQYQPWLYILSSLLLSFVFDDRVYFIISPFLTSNKGDHTYEYIVFTPFPSNTVVLFISSRTNGKPISLAVLATPWIQPSFVDV